MHNVLKRFLQPCYSSAENFSIHQLDFEEPVWQLISRKPSALRNKAYSSWDEELLSYMDEMLEPIPLESIKNQRWGSVNRLTMQHPMSSALPFFNKLIDMEPKEMPGDYYVPRVSRPYEGASQRMVVSPGRENEGIFHCPGGQSGHPLSVNYKDGHEAWMKGQPSSFLPGSPAHALILHP